jgi:hypothetical protein
VWQRTLRSAITDAVTIANRLSDLLIEMPPEREESTSLTERINYASTLRPQ